MHLVQHYFLRYLFLLPLPSVTLAGQLCLCLFFSFHFSPKLRLPLFLPPLCPVENKNLLLKIEKEVGSFRRTAGNLFEYYDFIEFNIQKNEENDKFMEENDYNYDSFYLLNFYGGDKKIDKFEGAPSRKKFVSWIEAKSPWIVHHLDEFDNFSDLKDKYKSLPIFTMFFPQDDFPSQDSLIRQIELVSDSFKHSILFSYYSLYVPFPFILLLPSFQVFSSPFIYPGAR